MLERVAVGGGGVGRLALCVGLRAFAAGDGGPAKLFDGLEDGLAGLLAEDLAEQHAERADVAAQRSFLELAGGACSSARRCGQLGGDQREGMIDYALMSAAISESGSATERLFADFVEQRSCKKLR